MSTHTEWYVSQMWYKDRNRSFKLEEWQERCIDTLCAWEQIYNLPIIDGFEGFKWNPGVQGLVIYTYNTLSTFDSDNLTRLVLAAHRNCVRVQVSPAHPYDSDRYANSMQISLHARDRDSMSLYSRHPSLTQLREKITSELDFPPGRVPAGLPVVVSEYMPKEKIGILGMGGVAAKHYILADTQIGQLVERDPELLIDILTPWTVLYAHEGTDPNWDGYFIVSGTAEEVMPEYPHCGYNGTYDTKQEAEEARDRMADAERLFEKMYGITPEEER